MEEIIWPILACGAAIMGMENGWCQDLVPRENILNDAKKISAESGAIINITDDILLGVKGADVIYTDVWVSMGEEDRIAEKISLLKEYQVNKEMILDTDNPEVVFMHCLPSYHDINTRTGKEVFIKYGLESMEVSDDIFRSKHSVVFDQAENRLHTIKAVMIATLGC